MIKEINMCPAFAMVKKRKKNKLVLTEEENNQTLM